MSISVEVRGDANFEQYQRLLENLSNPKHKEALLHNIGEAVVDQTRKRIQDEKTAPNGTPWQEWSDSYAKTRHSNQSPLIGNNDLLESIIPVFGKDKVRIGSPLAYARVHQDGFSGAVQVDAHTRVVSQAFGKALKTPATQNVSAFTRMMNIPQREFLGLSGENQTEIYAVIGDFWQGLMQ